MLVDGTMAIVGIGVDIARISRIAQSIDRYGDRFLRRVYHPSEIAFSQTRRNGMEFLAACFAVKEAALKALSDFPGRGIAWSDIYISHAPTGKPILHLEGRALVLAKEKGVRLYHVTLSHDGDMAVAQVVLES
ncbi:MAG: holo-ACP synthase [Candidatus Omnitrophica bacterium]|nr:holo-ACP synthase [Candidatus Omnitrophota bacterium]HXK95313.1 holo-ACP synthase [bacterium]